MKQLFHVQLRIFQQVSWCATDYPGSATVVNLVVKNKDVGFSTKNLKTDLQTVVFTDKYRAIPENPDDGAENTF